MASRKKKTTTAKKKFVEPTRFLVTEKDYEDGPFIVTEKDLSEYVGNSAFKIEVIEKTRVVNPRISVSFD